MGTGVEQGYRDTGVVQVYRDMGVLQGVRSCIGVHEYYRTTAVQD